MSALSQFILISFIFLIRIKINAFEYCTKFEIKSNHTYHPLRHCQRSNGTIIGLRIVKNLDDCVSFARERSALAFNFGPKYRGSSNRFEILNSDDSKKTESWMMKSYKAPKSKLHESPKEFYNCQLLDCPEYGNFTGMVNDTRFDYYSLYAKPPRKPLFLSNIFLIVINFNVLYNSAPYNSTCIPQVGMFILFQKPSNYTFAYKTCQSLGGVLAHVVSEHRTNTLANYLKENLNLTISKEAYIGLNETQKLGKFNTSSNEPLDCFLFRAWAPGHPP
uniref:CSON012136 protein n=1 Tax=Culicoides sonorensis TaxID=179676 RepID=A0A336KJ24_CULSO